MQPASQYSGDLYGGYLLVLGVAFLIIGVFYIFSRDALRREHLEKWLFIVLNLLGGTFSEAPRRKSAREGKDHETLEAEVDPEAETKD